MAETETILQHWIFTKFAFPFLLVFFIVFGVLEKTKLLGEGKKQLNALISFVISLIFVSVAYPKIVVSNMVLFLTVALVVVFVALLLWGFIFTDIKEGFKLMKWMKWILGLAIGVGLFFAVLWATGWEEGAINFLFKQSWSNTFWTNFLFLVVVAIALALILKSAKDK